MPDEPTHLAILRRSDFAGVRQALDLLSREWHLDLSVLAAEVVGLHPRRAAQISLHGDVIGVVGELHPTLAKANKLNGAVSFLEVDVDALLAASGDVAYQPISRFPSIVRDLAVVVADEVTWADVQRALKSYRIEFVSQYRGSDIPAGSRSLAMRITFGSDKRTLTDAEADAGVAQVLDILKTEFKAALRS